VSSWFVFFPALKVREAFQAARWFLTAEHFGYDAGRLAIPG
jgi:hypothetical protein